MKTPPTMTQFLALLSVLILPIVGWGISMEIRTTNQELYREAMLYRIEQNEKKNEKLSENVVDIYKNTTTILLELEKLKK
jgi:hypothetical protein